MTNKDIEITQAFETDQARTWLREMLSIGPATVTFTKKNGETRVMTCTLSEKLIPTEFQSKPLAEGQEPRKRSTESLSVWDLNANGWRSFIYKNITSVSVILSEEHADRVEGVEQPISYD